MVCLPRSVSSAAGPVAGARVAMQAVELLARPTCPTTAWTKSAWQRTQLTCTIRRSRGLISMGSLKFCSVNASEWRNPWSALATHFARPPCGRWQSTQTAVWRWPLLSQASYCGFMMWQLTHVRGSVERYEKPLA